MNVKFVVVGLLIIGGLFYGTEKYWQHEFEETARNGLKNFSYTPEMKDAMKDLPIKADILNQYPNLFFYVDFTQEIPAQAEAIIKTKLMENSQRIACQVFSRLPEKEDKDKAKAIVNVIEEDNVAMTYIVKARFGKVLMEHKQVLTQCPEFQLLKQSVS
ncbi:hypothetical protein QTA56_06575 [Acinetobacter sp. VNH17]|uniref:Uncharacterized protein n=1 Tax=Acinetobacter thutiue TaxID=2998078 RepID=A0ABT7WMP2_9GAMM|nr:hypothetical protein [Acinetobacter thutiue]MCY6411805.1 hypothetical protein [Acinetobacter thutiue]MDN0013907.1 hypothetical protein [Acinetobacter thutiue]